MIVGMPHQIAGTPKIIIRKEIISCINTLLQPKRILELLHLPAFVKELIALVLYYEVYVIVVLDFLYDML